jgi:hypothetical protein
MYAVIHFSPIDKPNEKFSRKGFLTESSAWDYIFSTMCDSCKLERKVAVSGRDRFYDEYACVDRVANLRPACSKEYMIIDGSELDPEFLVDFENIDK